MEKKDRCHYDVKEENGLMTNGSSSFRRGVPVNGAYARNVTPGYAQ